MKQKKFGRLPQAERSIKITKSRHFKVNKFENLSHTPDLAEGVTYSQVLKEFIFERSKTTLPKSHIPTVKSNLHQLSKKLDCIVWFGHSSYYLQLNGISFLIDPVFSKNASPLWFTTKSFKGTAIYSAADLPSIDYLLISHDHWDHLDYSTVSALKQKVKKVVTGLGTAEHLILWGYEKERIIELDWNEALPLENELKLIATPARHFSGRGFKRNQALWLSFVLKSPDYRIYLGADSGYDSHFKSIGEEFGPFDLAVLECGQYNKNWKYIHMMPEEVIQAGQDLNAERVMPVHWGKFALAQHAWDEPILRVKEEALRKNFPLLHPQIGEIVELENKEQKFTEWWNGIT